MMRRSQRWAGAIGIALVLAARAPLASAQTPAELKAARELFQEAYKDEQEKRYPDALEKFQRVAKVKESASVRYRIATVLAAMGRLREARDAYRSLAAAKSTLPPSDRETADSAAEKAAELDRRIPKLALRVEENAPSDTQVTVDGTPVAVSTAPRSIELDPGDHVVATTAGGSRSEQTITLRDGAGEVPHTVTIAPEKRPPPAEPSPAPKSKTLPWIAIGAGGALVATGAVLLVAREGAIGDIEAACPGNVCPTSRRSEVEGDRDRAQLFGPLGGGLAVAGLVAVGVGVYLLVRSTPSSATALSIGPMYQPPLRAGGLTGGSSVSGLRFTGTF